MLAACAAEAPSIDTDCTSVTHEGQPFTVCAFDVSEDIRLFLNDETGAPIAQFDTLAARIEAEGKTLVFAMNAGMYHEDRRPVGWYVDEAGQAQVTMTREGPGNFGMLPNGVLYKTYDGMWDVRETMGAMITAKKIDYATQSGPMLVIDGELHPKINPDGTSRKRRNGVGISADKQTLYFAISDSLVTFHEFATLFRDELGAPNALFLDGTVSRVYAPDVGRDEQGLDMGPIVGVVR